MAAVVAALSSDEDRDYGEIELEIPGSTCLSLKHGFRVSSDEWKHGIEPAPNLTFIIWGRRTVGKRADWSRWYSRLELKKVISFACFTRREALLQIADSESRIRKRPERSSGGGFGFARQSGNTIAAVFDLIHRVFASG